MKGNSSLAIERQIRLDMIYGYQALNIAIFYINRYFALPIYHLGKVYAIKRRGYKMSLVTTFKIIYKDQKGVIQLSFF